MKSQETCMEKNLELKICSYLSNLTNSFTYLKSKTVHLKLNAFVVTTA